MDDKIINKIKKLLALSTNNTSYEEAQSAILKAQRLMAKYDIDVMDINEGEDEEEIKVSYEYVKISRAWKYELASIIANNFRCKSFTRGRNIAFYGRSTDSEVAKEVFSFLFKLGHSHANKMIYKKAKEDRCCVGIYNSYVVGYMDGIKSKLEEQSTKLALVIPKEVEEEYENYVIIKKMGVRKCKSLVASGMDSDSYKTGLYDGKHAMQSREICNK
ncbi:TPA: DUF2786 domain-containing protein [Clostridioides difficile]|uniref:DUF2786 domain-containing protein n=1 Tax=Clostridioides TaxID=1870884 RepID=UPI00131A7F77|nr:DUF2786 domain-containing protein [Clostridioides difficile]MCC0641612.1 DUF2786 domain-containing protein [Clostridioides sp. ES-S-0049-03]MCC0677314.1 DUF2786 domain-containing protein [Clostridioides sp. ES-W-0018-02]MCC0712463.1 DUF2786 domain-containing protein [Clostridioides sp. ES-W-0017-02]EGT4836513.1 DUF2786 domain-containing protein [Clostridioides difficile]EGT4910224.1 DUF2786 domain-containing protein [Clostridioides difficile]